MINEIERRRTFAIIAHPDAGKTSLTEKLLLFGGQIQVAGAVKSNKIKKSATSDWMDIEKQRGISVTTSVMEFDYHDYKVNILDTPGHQDFAEDTYRTLTAVDSVECFHLWRTQAGLDLVGPRYFGIDTDYIPVEERSARKEA